MVDWRTEVHDVVTEGVGKGCRGESYATLLMRASAIRFKLAPERSQSDSPTKKCRPAGVAAAAESRSSRAAQQPSHAAAEPCSSRAVHS